MHKTKNAYSVPCNHSTPSERPSPFTASLALKDTFQCVNYVDDNYPLPCFSLILGVYHLWLQTNSYSYLCHV